MLWLLLFPPLAKSQRVSFADVIVSVYCVPQPPTSFRRRNHIGFPPSLALFMACLFCPHSHPYPRRQISKGFPFLARFCCAPALPSPFPSPTFHRFSIVVGVFSAEGTRRRWWASPSRLCAPIGSSPSSTPLPPWKRSICCSTPARRPYRFFSGSASGKCLLHKAKPYAGEKTHLLSGYLLLLHAYRKPGFCFCSIFTLVYLCRSPPNPNAYEYSSYDYHHLRVN